MSERNWISTGCLGLIAALWLCALVSPAWAEPLYRWQTEQGTVAFSDDLAKVPAHFRDQVSTREMLNLRDYARLTHKDREAMGQYQEDLVDRLNALRERVAHLAPTREAEIRSQRQVLSLRTGGPDAPSIELDAGNEGGEPLVVETVTTRPSDRLTTRRSLVVRRGGQTLALVRPRLHEWNVAEDLHIEGENGY
ncbi:DUF4124 domain-containing protein [Myxococcota bacterium]|nr:DUF4124 domain-containing protein [Myxococcota bacterium]